MCFLLDEEDDDVLCATESTPSHPSPSSISSFLEALTLLGEETAHGIGTFFQSMVLISTSSSSTSNILATVIRSGGKYSPGARSSKSSGPSISLSLNFLICD